MPQKREQRRGPRRRSRGWEPPNPFLLLDMSEADRRVAMGLSSDASDEETEGRYGELYGPNGTAAPAAHGRQRSPGAC